MMTMAKLIPSGKPPQMRMTQVMTPIPAPKIQQPRRVSGEVTMSVAMKNAPIITPPVMR